MGVEWFRDLGIAVLAFMTTVLVVFVGILAYFLSHAVRSTLSRVNAAAKVASATATMVQEAVSPLVMVLAVFQGIGQGLQSFSKKLRKPNGKGEHNE